MSRFCVLVFALLFAFSGLASAQQPVRIVIGFAPGASIDSMARVLADQMGPLIGRTVIVENKTGAGGRLAASEVKRSAPDGNTLLLAPSLTTALAPLLYENLNYKSEDFAPVGYVSSFDFAIAVHPSHPAKSLRELIDYMKANPAQANYGASSTGGVVHLIGLDLATRAGVQITHIPYSGGSPMMTALVGGHVPTAMNQVGTFVDYHKAGKIRVLATFGRERDPQLPDVKTAAEQGFAVDGSAWHGLYVPTGTPKELVAKYNQAMNTVLKSDAMRKVMVQFSQTVGGGSPQDLEKLQKQTQQHFGALIRAHNVKGN